MHVNTNELNALLNGKTPHATELFHYFIKVFSGIGNITVHPAKTMTGIANSHKRVVYITQLGKDFIHVVFPFHQPYPDNLCFQKIAEVPGKTKQFNHHLRIYRKEDVNEEVLYFMKLAYLDEQG